MPSVSVESITEAGETNVCVTLASGPGAEERTKTSVSMMETLEGGKVGVGVDDMSCRGEGTFAREGMSDVRRKCIRLGTAGVKTAKTTCFGGKMSKFARLNSKLVLFTACFYSCFQHVLKRFKSWEPKQDRSNPKCLAHDATT